MANNYAPVISPAGITADNFATTLAKLTADYQAIFGADVYLGNDSQDGQLLAALARAVTDLGALTVAAYNAFSPATAQGNGLSSVVKINGLTRLMPSASTAQVLVVGVVGTVINSGAVRDQAGNVWSLPTSVTIPAAGQIAVTAACQTLGAVTVQSGAVTIANPQFGWQSATVTGLLSTGAPLETDAALRIRQSVSTTLPATTITSAILADLENLSGVTRAAAYENNSTATDSNGIPAGSVAFIVEGGAAADIFGTIALKLPPGGVTFGAQSTTVVSGSLSRVVRYSTPVESAVSVALVITPLGNWTTDAEPIIAQAVAQRINQWPIGKALSFTSIIVTAYIAGTEFAGTFTVQTITLSKDGSAPAQADIPAAWNEAFNCPVGNVTFTVA